MSITNEAPQHWLKMGVELEGGWNKDYARLAQEVEGARGKTDSSVHGLEGHMGEITTRPNTNLESLLKDVRYLHPDHTNESAGLHIHASFTDLHLTLLTSEDFYKYFRKRWEEWGEKNQGRMSRKDRDAFWDRFHMRSNQAKRYCKDIFMPGKQLTDFNHDDRYTQLNFVSYKKFKTVECRLLPMFGDPDLTCDAITELGDIYSSFLHTYTFPDLQMKVEFKTEDEYLLEEETMATPDIGFKEDSYSSTFTSLVSRDDSEDVFYHIEGAEDCMKPFRTTVGGSHA